MISKLRDLDRTSIAIAGGKGANLGELCKIEGVNVPDGFCITEDDDLTQISHFVDEHTHYAVRSSATAEDLPTASFAGQHDTYLNIIGTNEIVKYVAMCRASLHSDRAIAYRKQNGFDNKKVSIAVIVQKMVNAEVSGVMFTADPVTSNRKIISIESTVGLGESFVSGTVNSNNQLLTEKQKLELEQLGRKIEKHFGAPQDIEWCLADNEFYIVQSRPITTLFPIPKPHGNENRVYISVGHQQMMTDAMKPLGLTMWQMIASAPMAHAAGRLFVDVTPGLSSVKGRENLMNMMGQHDPLIKDALETIIERDFIKLLPETEKVELRSFSDIPPIENDPGIVTNLIIRLRALSNDLKKNIQFYSGVALFDFIREDVRHFRGVMQQSKTMQAIMAVINASAWLNKNIEEWLGEKNVADVITQSVENNITSEMGLALLDVADSLRSGKKSNALDNFLEWYGMRCVGEIDITRPRWAEEPAELMALINANIKNFQPGERKRRFDRGLNAALLKENEILERLDDQKAAETKEKINLLRTFAGFREYPKYIIIRQLFVYKKALMKEADQLVSDGVINTRDDVYYLTFDDFREVVRTRKADYDLINKRKEEFEHFEKLTPPRVITSDGEIIRGKYKKENLPANALVGLAVSSGVVEGRARVITNFRDANLEEGDILVTTFTDPSWTPLFVLIKGLVAEVGGLMTHGAVIAREYGLPAVVGVENATVLIKDGTRIRVNGTLGFIEII
ncbi:MAG: phosphoenolpyruvate synthase [Bacteroidota bacterium]